MTLAGKAASVLGYRILPTSVLALLAYVAIFIALAVTDTLPNVPPLDKQGGLNLKEAYEDLRHITAHPHPYNSHANDKVHDYILSRLIPLAKEHEHVHVSNDLVSNGSWASSAYGVYFEGTNILVKIDGTEGSTEGGVLFSAHYDSVSTAPGATDDGMGVATILQLVKFFAGHRMKRAAIFNINNGEEDWLNGAHAFLKHPWSELADTFLNLEGAAAGGRPILFRATSTSPVRSFHDSKLVPHPHANVLSSDAFSRGLIRSGTDFSVYAGPGSHAGMEGLDLAFYKGRSRYHTKYDAVQYTLGGEKSLWSMMEVARGVGTGLLETSVVNGPRGEVDFADEPVYFDLFKVVVVVFPLASLLTFNIVTLIVGPIVLALLLVCERVIFRHRNEEVEDEQVEPHSSTRPSSSRNHSSRLHNGPHDGDEHPNHQHHPSGSHSSGIHWVQSVWRHLKFWVALAVTGGLQILLMWAYVAVNPFAIYSSPYIVLFSFLTLAYLALVFTLTLPSSLPFYHPKHDPAPNHWLLRPAQQQKHTIFFHLYFFTWVLLVLSTVGITQLHPGLGSGYLVSAWNACVGVGCVIGAIEGLVTSPYWKVREEYDELEGDEGDEDRGLPHRSHRHVEDADESTPLILRENEAAHPRHLAHVPGEEGGGLATWWWIPQFLVSVPFPVILLGHVTMLVLDGMSQTLADGASAWTVYAAASLLAALLTIPLAPFAYKLRPSRPLSLFVFIIFLLSTLYGLFVFPFSVENPLKVYFQQRIFVPSDDLSPNSTSATMVPRLLTSLSGPSRYLYKSLIPSLPSSQESTKYMLCRGEYTKPGLMTCEWDSGAKLMPIPGLDTSTSTSEKWEEGQFFKANVTRTGPTSARIRVKGRNTRACRLYFDSSPVHEYSVRSSRRLSRVGGRENEADDEEAREDQETFANVGHDGEMQEGYEIGPKGVKEVRLWSRAWENEFRVDVDWANGTHRGETVDMNGRIACEWVEYESALVDNGRDLGRGTGMSVEEIGAEVADATPKIPALEEALAFLPEWATVSKFGDGLVEAWTKFSV
ncbi:hypothetical protein GALMADRAFT_160277 [Galerina marginata CBS 339.88]|uniref:Peptide hydrolase n=1 Tax=Galerina marginata (strain CBS 339.88) TaxID=685588 RepID=A0A067SIE2_GALM3|nr:hypothetical protein GALMADRAFT_160277 [Galerina marginata CBS 339.88]